MRSGSPLLFADASTSLRLSRGAAVGKVRRIARGLYTRDLETAVTDQVRRGWLEITAHFLPGAIVTDRSARQLRPDDNGVLFVVHDRARPLELPGLTIVPRPGHAPLPDDVSSPHGLFAASRPRALLENLLPSRARSGRPPRTLSRREVHEWVMHLLRSEGAARLNGYRDRAREIAPTLGLSGQMEELDRIIGAALGTQQVETESEQLAAAQRGLAFDDHRDRLFFVLFEELSARAPSPRPVLPMDRPRLKTVAFFEAYFSNFIEGTEFTVEEAAQIVFEDAIPANRRADAHDVSGTYEVVSSDAEMKHHLNSVDDFLETLRTRHARLLQARPEMRSGQLKLRPNRVGTTEFVRPELVRGTLARGFELVQRLEDPFARAVMMLFVISEVHPFDDGNGRVARVMMNAELVRADEHRILIPTVFRNEYLSGLRALTHNAQPRALIRVLDFAQRYSMQIDFSSVDAAKRQLEETNAFLDSSLAESRGVRLTLPSVMPR